ncbi:substrate-binding domain-containing protein [Bradyrhizobium liaoningense]|uniref:substrate-binding domain-containing protein n=1 Tax=Bradyrhizobium liaoningense TaxID=43992 RepID=UPI001BA5D4B2|nr:substrate-binding domain-containing protein [Bradyrhizobium liaoningense]MBR0858046.1 substrate-binding domain-containing protein [Bradyrhizobium liaoningense]
MSTSDQTAITLLSAIAVHAEIEELLPRFRREQGVEVRVNYDVNPSIAQRVMAGETFDVGLNNPWYVEEMIASGRVIPDVHVPFARVPLAIGAAGLPAKDIVNSHEAVSALLAGSQSIAYTDTGTSGKTFLRAIELMGLKHQISDRLRPMGAGQPPIAAAQGQVQYAIAPLSRIIAAPGVSPVATFPSELNLDIDMSLFIHIRTEHLDLARQLVRFLSDPSHDAYLQSHGISRYAQT